VLRSTTSWPATNSKLSIAGDVTLTGTLSGLAPRGP
jgi:hypothetical protein